MSALDSLEFKAACLEFAAAWAETEVGTNWQWVPVQSAFAASKVKIFDILSDFV